MASLRSYLAALLALVMVLTSQTMAVARGMELPSGEMVLCIGDGSVTVYVDADGQPVDAPHYCPDCAAAGSPAVLTPSFVPNLRPLGRGVAMRIDPGVVFTTGEAVPASARGPPSSDLIL